jgi:hypothetical protein
MVDDLYFQRAFIKSLASLLLRKFNFSRKKKQEVRLEGKTS